MNKLKKFQQLLKKRKNPKTNGKFHTNFVHYFIDRIKRKEKGEKFYRNNGSNNIFNSSTLNTNFSNKSGQKYYYNMRELKNSNSEIS